MLITACGSSSDTNNEDEPLNGAAGSTELNQTNLFFLEQVTGSSGSGPGDITTGPVDSSNESSSSPESADTYNVYQVNVGNNGQTTKVNTTPFEHFKMGYLLENSEDSTLIYETVVWLQDEALMVATSRNTNTFLIDTSTITSPLCSLDDIESNQIFTEHSTHKLIVAGPDFECDSRGDNQYYLVEAKPNGGVRPMPVDDFLGQYGNTIYTKNEDQSFSMYKAYYDNSRGITEIVDTQTLNIVTSYAFELPQSRRFIANNQTYILDDDRLYHFTATELVSGEFDLESSYIPLSESIGSYSFEPSPGTTEIYFSLADDRFSLKTIDKVYLTGQEGIKTLDLENGKISTPLILTTDLSYPNLNFVEGSSLVFAIDNRIIYLIDLSNGQVDQLYQITSSSYGWSQYQNKLLLTEYSSVEDAKATHIIDTVDGLVLSFQDASWEYVYYQGINENIKFLIKEGTEENSYQSSIELFDLNELGTFRNLGSANVENLKLGYSFSSRYQLATDASRTHVYFFDLEVENSVTLIMQVEGEVRF